MLQPFVGLLDANSWGADGRVATTLTRLIEAATRQGKVDSLADEVAEALKRSPNWIGGRLLLAVLKAERGKADEAREEIEAVLAGDVPVPTYARMAIGQEIGEIAAEFFRKAGESAVHPAVGLVAFLVEPGGVRLRSLAPVGPRWGGPVPLGSIGPRSNEPTPPADRDDPARRRGAVALKADGWNTARVALKGRPSRSRSTASSSTSGPSTPTTCPCSASTTTRRRPSPWPARSSCAAAGPRP